MPTPRELEAMNLSESEALGKMVLFQMEEPEGRADDLDFDDFDNLNFESEIDNQKPYATSRPNYTKDQVEMVWELAKDPITGKVMDPSGVEIIWDRTKPRKGQWDMGHLPDHKYSEKHKLYMEGKLTKEEFLAWYRNPLHYRPELSSTNRSHKYE